MKPSETIKPPTASLHVVDPAYLSINIVPHNNPALIIDENYIFAVKMFDKNNHRIKIAEVSCNLINFCNLAYESFQNVRIKMELSTEYFDTSFLSSNGSYALARSQKLGKTRITVTNNIIDLYFFLKIIFFRLHLLLLLWMDNQRHLKIPLMHI